MLHLLMLFMLADPFVGTWKLRADQAQKGGLDSFTITVTPTANGHKWAYDIVPKGGKGHLQYTIVTDRKAGKFTMTSADGKVMGEGKLILKGPTEWEVDSPTHKSHGSISADGKTMTVETTAPRAATHVLDKQ